MKYGLLVILVLSLLTPALLAKRIAPVDVPSVKIGDVEFSAPHDKMACVVARDTKTGDTWWRQIYVVVRQENLEKDVQDVFINSLQAKDGVLLITNESGSQFQLDPQTMDVKVIKGSQFTRKK